eukprot:3934863-Rhodomonas_salina.1
MADLELCRGQGFFCDLAPPPHTGKRPGPLLTAALDVLLDQVPVHRHHRGKLSCLLASLCQTDTASRCAARQPMPPEMIQALLR